MTEVTNKTVSPMPFVLYQALKATLRAQEALNTALRVSASTISDTAPAARTDRLILIRLKILNNYWGDFQVNHMQLFQNSIPRDHPYIAEGDYARAKLNYIMVGSQLSDARDRIHPDPAQPASPPDHHRGTTRLPRIIIPMLPDRRKDCDSFGGMFFSLVYNDPSLSNVDRLYYLKCHVEGEAKSALSNITVTWRTFDIRYNNRRLVVHDHLKSIKTFPSPKEKSDTEFQFSQDELSRYRAQLCSSIALYISAT